MASCHGVGGAVSRRINHQAPGPRAPGNGFLMDTLVNETDAKKSGRHPSQEHAEAGREGG